jgi:hypothetical protein
MPGSYANSTNAVDTRPKHITELLVDTAIAIDAFSAIYTVGQSLWLEPGLLSLRISLMSEEEAVLAETRIAAAETKIVNLSSLRQAAVRDAWAQERQLVQETGQGTRNWTELEMEELRQNGKVSGYQGHHINSVSEYPNKARDPNNIRFLTPQEHFETHDFNWRNPTSGSLILRQ